MIEAESSVMLGDRTRAVFDHWSDGVQSSSRHIYVPERLDISAIYLTEYLLSVESSMSETIGSGWYPAGMNATFAALTPLEPEHASFGIHVTYKFSHWSGDSESTSPTSWVVMDRPKTVAANWSEDTSDATLAFQLVIISLIFLSCSAMLIAVAVSLRRKGRVRSYHVGPRRNSILRGLLLGLVFSAAFAHFPAVQPARALTLLQPESITIGDAVWYHWNAAESDTCLIWLGGGIVGQLNFMVNPLEFESYNTVRFIQDLAQYYDVLALKKGSMRSVDPTLNKTVYGEPYPGSNDFIEKIRLWAYEQGYAYLYVVGYSVGAMVAAQELVLKNPNGWTSPNGLIIITTKMPQEATRRAGSLRASLLMLYGDKIAPEFTESGERFFQNAPEEGWRDGYWYHKEYHVIPDVEHEVWTIRDSGEYDGRAVLLTVKFIEASKSLQFGRVNWNLSGIVLNSTANDEARSAFKVGITSVKSPARVRTEEVFKISTTVQYEFASDFRVAVVAFDIDTASVLSAAERHLTGSGEAQFVTTLVSGNSMRTWRFSLIPLVYSEDGLRVVAEGTSNVVVDVTDTFTLTVIMPYPNLPVEFDGEILLAGATGEVAVNATPGEHSVSVPSVVMLGNTSRAIFHQWNDTSSSTSLHLALSSDLALLALYRQQHYLTVTSTFGQATGAGWYDENSTARFQVAPLLATGETARMFVRWSGDSEDPSPAASVFMDSPKNVQALWEDQKRPEADVRLLQFQWLFMLSSLILIGSLIFTVMSIRARRRSATPEMSPSSP